MQTKQRIRVQIRTPGDLIAAVPHLLGFEPAESLVICAHRGPRGNEVGVCIRTDIPPPESYRDLAEQLKIPILRSNAGSVTVLLVCAAEGGPPDPLPYRGQVTAITEVFSAAGIVVDHTMWTPKIADGSPWWCYDTKECNGTVPDPHATELAAATVATGTTTYRSRDEMRATLEPADRRLLAARAKRIAAALGQRPDIARARKLVDDVFTDIKEGTFTLDEDRIVDLAVALTHGTVRDSCLRPEVVKLGSDIEDLWLELTRATPAPYRAEPASLLAVMTFLRGDGALAGVAVDAALEANPEHWLSILLRRSMDLGLPPSGVREAIAQGFDGVECPPGNC
jgi:hypothetical protein